MRTLCFEGYCTQRFGRVEEFCQERIERKFEELIEKFCNEWLEEEFTVQSGAGWYERNEGRRDRRNGHYFRRLVTSRGAIRLAVPRGENGQYEYSLFEHYERYTEEFEEIVFDALIKGHSTRNASKFFGKVFGTGTISHQAASASLRQCDEDIAQWKRRALRDNAVVVIVDAVYLGGVIPYVKYAKPVLFAYAVYADGHEEVLDYEIATSESKNNWYRFTQQLWDRGLQKVDLVVHDDTEAITEATSLTWPRALNQQCVFHIMKNFSKKLSGDCDKKEIIQNVQWLYEAQSEDEFLRWVQQFQRKWEHKKWHKAIKYLFKMMPDSIRYFRLPKKYWTIAKTSNRLERLFEELKRRIKPFRRFPNTKSCDRWLYALLQAHKERLRERTSKTKSA